MFEKLLPSPDTICADQQRDFDLASAVVREMERSGKYSFDSQLWCDKIQSAIETRRKELVK